MSMSWFTDYVTILQMDITYARAGGGENYVDSGSSYSGSSSGGSSYHGGYSSGSFSILGLIILIVIFIVARKMRSALAAKFPQKLGNQALQDTSGGLAALKQKDPSFDEQNFKDKANTAFFKIQLAWEKKDMDIARPFITDAILQRYTVQLQQLKEKHLTNKMENMAVGAMTIADISSDDRFDKITVKIDASAADYTIDDSTGKIVKGSQTPSHFDEYWTFIRSKTAKTDSTKSLKDNKCPNCGAALEVSATGKCNYCSSILTSGEYDWVLSEITQSGEWEKHSVSRMLGGGGNIGGAIENAVGGAIVTGIMQGLLGGRRRR